MSLQGKNVVLGVTGSIAAYKAADLISRLRKQGAAVYVIMTRAACEFITPLTMESMSGNPVVSDMFARVQNWEVEHISLAKKADIFVIAPASANIIAKAAHGLADDMLSTTLLATRAPVLIAPAMNTAMYENELTQENIAALAARGVAFVTPGSGRLACGDHGSGKLADTALIEQTIADMLTEHDCEGLSVLVTAGPTREAVDPVRFLSNHSTGKMGYAIAARAQARGASVTLISGPSALTPPPGVRTLRVVSAEDMYRTVMDELENTDIVIKAAAVGDYRPASRAEDKIKKKADDMSIALVRNPDILAEIGRRKKEGQTICGFSMETRDLIENSRAKLEKKNCDLMVANNLKDGGAGFAHDTNAATLLYRDGRAEKIDLMRKDALADIVIDRLLALRQGK